MYKKLTLTLLLSCLPHLAQGENRLAVGALAFHAYPVPDSRSFVAPLDNSRMLVGLPYYLSLSHSFRDSEDKVKRLATVSLFNNCYNYASVATTYSINVEDASTKRFDLFFGGGLYVRQKDANHVATVLEFENDDKNIGFSFFPAFILTYKLTRNVSAELALSGISIFQISWRL